MSLAYEIDECVWELQVALSKQWRNVLTSAAKLAREVARMQAYASESSQKGIRDVELCITKQQPEFQFKG